MALSDWFPDKASRLACGFGPQNTPTKNVSGETPRNVRGVRGGFPFSFFAAVFSEPNPQAKREA